MSTPDLGVEFVDLDTLTPDPKNARRHSSRNLSAIAASLTEFGQRRPLVVSHSGVVLAGNGTLEAARSLGWQRIAVTRTPEDWTEDTARAYALADNRTAELAEWNEDILGTQLVALDAKGWDIAALGFEPVPDVPVTDDEDEPEQVEPPAEPITKDGDLWVMGDHRLLCGDSFDEEHRAYLLDGQRVAMVATDPPYAIYGSSTGIGADIADDKMVRPFFESLARVCSGHLETFGHAYFFTDWRSWSALWEGAKRGGLAPKNMLVWDKGGGGMGNNYANCHELVAYYIKAPKARAMASRQETGQRPVLRPNILRFSRVTGDERQHNAAKPVALMEELIANSSERGDLVLDLFGGSGSTLLAAHNLGRRACLMEMEPKFCDVIVGRWEKLSGQKAERVPRG